MCKLTDWKVPMRFRVLLPALLLAGYLGIYQGQLALFRDGDPLPKEVFPYAVYLYPPAQQQMLREGIPFSDEAQLHRLLENYLS